MSSATDFLEKKLADHSFGITSWTKPTAVFAVLLSASPTDTGSQTNEITGTAGLTRPSITASMNAAGATNGLTDNANAIEIGPCSSDPAAAVTHAATADASTVGNYLVHAANTASRTLLTGDSFRWAASQLNALFA